MAWTNTSKNSASWTNTSRNNAPYTNKAKDSVYQELEFNGEFAVVDSGLENIAVNLTSQWANITKN